MKVAPPVRTTRGVRWICRAHEQSIEQQKSFIMTPFASIPPTTAVRSTLFELVLTACERALSRNWFGGKRACPWLFSFVGPNKVFRLILSSWICQTEGQNKLDRLEQIKASDLQFLVFLVPLPSCFLQFTNLSTFQFQVTFQFCINHEACNRSSGTVSYPFFCCS